MENSKVGTLSFGNLLRKPYDQSRKSQCQPYLCSFFFNIQIVLLCRSKTIEFLTWPFEILKWLKWTQRHSKNFLGNEIFAPSLQSLRRCQTKLNQRMWTAKILFLHSQKNKRLPEQNLTEWCWRFFSSFVSSFYTFFAVSLLCTKTAQKEC